MCIRDKPSATKAFTPKMSIFHQFKIAETFALSEKCESLCVSGTYAVSDVFVTVPTSDESEEVGRVGS